MRSINIGHRRLLGKTWDPRKKEPRNQGYFRNLAKFSGAWWVSVGGEWHEVIEPGPMGECVDDLQHKAEVTIYIS